MHSNDNCLHHNNKTKVDIKNTILGAREREPIPTDHIKAWRLFDMGMSKSILNRDNRRHYSVSCTCNIFISPHAWEG